MRELRTSLKELRMEAGFTQSELAEIVGNCRDNISRLERNKFNVAMLVRHDEDGKYYLYDIMNIKKETSTPLEQ